MRRSLFAAACCLFCAACGGGSSTPSAPSAARQALTNDAPGAALTPVTSGTLSMFGSSSADLARCLSGAGDAACFSATRPVVGVATAGAAAPAAPGTLTATASGSSVTLTWSAPGSGDPVVTYLIEAGSASGLSDLANFATGNTATTFSTGGVPDGTYYVRIKAQNAAGTSAASNEATLVVGTAACTSAPGAPTGLTSSVSGSTLTFTWSAPSGGCAPTSYVLQAGSTTGSSALANSNVGNVTSFVATAVPAGTYYVRVRAQNGSGQSAASNEVTATVAPAASPITVSISPNPVPMAGPVSTGSCAGYANTWTYTNTFQEIAGVGVTVTHSYNTSNGQPSNDFSQNFTVAASGSRSFATTWCTNGTSGYTVQTTWTGTDARGNTFSHLAPAVTLLPKTTTGCTLSVSPTSQSFSTSAGTGTVSVTATPSGCSSSWTATSSSSFISITSGSSGSTSGTVSYSVTANTGSASRTGTITVAGTTVTITQSGTTTTAKRTFPAVWVSASWSGGRRGTPLSSRGIDPPTHFGTLCLANSIKLENHPGEEDPSRIFFHADDSLFATNTGCSAAMTTVAFCRTAGSGGGASDIPTCSIDPRQTPFGNLRITAVSRSGAGSWIGVTPVNFDVNVLWCSDQSSFNLGRVSGVPNLECVEN